MTEFWKANPSKDLWYLNEYKFGCLSYSLYPPPPLSLSLSPSLSLSQFFPYCLNLLKSTLHKHMLKHLNDNKLLHPNQSGFRENHSCQTALTHLVDQWLHNINSNKFNGVLFVDFRKAFDVISHDLLLRKLSIYGVSSSMLAFLSSYLADRHQCVYHSMLTTEGPRCSG